MDLSGKIISFVFLVLGNFFVVKYVFPVASARAEVIIRLLYTFGRLFSF